MGGNINITDDYLGTAGFREILADLPEVKVAFNAVGGDGVNTLSQCLGSGATIVTYGGMSKRPVRFSPEMMAYKHISNVGFWISKWNERSSSTEKTTMMDNIFQAVREKKLTFFFEMHDFDDFQHALEKSLQPFQLRKTLLLMDYPDRLAEHDARDESDHEVFENAVAY